MPDQIREVRSEGWRGRLGGSIKGVATGAGLFLVSFPLLWWNEGRAVQTYRSLQEGRGAVVSVPSDPPDPANDQKLVHVSGLASTQEILKDPLLGVSAQAIRLIRDAETFQWTEDEKSEKRKKVGGSEETVTTYTYEMAWRAARVDSGAFHQPSGHENPDSLRVEAASWQASDVRLGGFQLSDRLAARITRSENLVLAPDSIAALPADLRADARLHDGAIYLGRDPAHPALGDARVTFRKVPPADVSVIARQSGNRLGPFQTRAGDRLEMLEAGILPADAMFAEAQKASSLLTWGLRFLGFLLMMMGVLIGLRPLRVLADVVPVIGTLVGIGLGFLAFAVAAPLTLLTIALAWIAHRPLLGGVLLAAFAAVAFWLGRGVARRRRAAMASPAAPRS